MRCREGIFYPHLSQMPGQCAGQDFPQSHRGGADFRADDLELPADGFQSGPDHCIFQGVEGFPAFSQRGDDRH